MIECLAVPAFFPRAQAQVRALSCGPAWGTSLVCGGPLRTCAGKIATFSEQLPLDIFTTLRPTQRFPPLSTTGPH